MTSTTARDWINLAHELKTTREQLARVTKERDDLAQKLRRKNRKEKAK